MHHSCLGCLNNSLTSPFAVLPFILFWNSLTQQKQEDNGDIMVIMVTHGYNGDNAIKTLKHHFRHFSCFEKQTTAKPQNLQQQKPTNLFYFIFIRDGNSSHVAQVSREITFLTDSYILKYDLSTCDNDSVVTQDSMSQ